ncbi:unnamed protein product [Moneuplotes crassus]|uniref:Uncharacterized protein n=1 Tax=Euplotes crassus TaxID=5936 RepID=A0AAD1X5W0_EUPCR|nr:unnamed protein product [Moneuplotes crassus]
MSKTRGEVMATYNLQDTDKGVSIESHSGLDSQPTLDWPSQSNYRPYNGSYYMGFNDGHNQ